MNDKPKNVGHSMREDLHPADNNKTFDEVYGKKGVQLSEEEISLTARYARMFESVYASSAPRVRG